MECTFKKWGKNHLRGPFYCEKAKAKVTAYRHAQYCKGPCYTECPIYKKSYDSDCFLATIFSKLELSNDISDSILENFKNFRRNILEKDFKYRDLLVYHDRISPFIADAIRNTNIDTIDEFLREIIFNSYLIPINEYIVSGQVDKAISYYEKMRELLIVNFSLNKEYASMQYRYQHPELYKPKSLFRSLKCHNKGNGQF